MKTISIATMVLSLLPAATNAQKPEDTEIWDPVPRIVLPVSLQKNPLPPPSDAVVLFNGSGFSEWTGIDSSNNPKTAEWKIKNGAMIVVPNTGDLKTKKVFGNCQLHLEFKTPVSNGTESSQMNGNSGVFLQERYEIQILDSYKNIYRTYSNGQCGSVYKQHIPLVNACAPPGEWQSFDIIFEAPRYNDDGSLKKPAIITAFHNGILIHDHVVVEGPCTYIGKPKYTAHGKAGLVLQDHGCAVSFRNIWLREL